MAAVAAQAELATRAAEPYSRPKITYASPALVANSLPQCKAHFRLTPSDMRRLLVLRFPRTHADAAKALTDPNIIHAPRACVRPTDTAQIKAL